MELRRPDVGLLVILVRETEGFRTDSPQNIRMKELLPPKKDNIPSLSSLLSLY